MQQYIGTKIINAKPMTRGEYNMYRRWNLPADENGDDFGYLVEYMDGGVSNSKDYKGYVSWSPAEQFENAYRKTDGMNFGLATEAMLKGKKVARPGWNGKGMFIYYVPANEYPAGQNHLGTMKGIFPDDMVPYGEYTAMKTADNKVIPWLCSQTDQYATDWLILED